MVGGLAQWAEIRKNSRIYCLKDKKTRQKINAVDQVLSCLYHNLNKCLLISFLNGAMGLIRSAYFITLSYHFMPTLVALEGRYKPSTQLQLQCTIL